MMGPKDGHCARTVVNTFHRLEYQDGKRKQATQSYHGRGAIHSHSIEYCDNAAAMHPAETFAASVSSLHSPIMRGIAYDCQNSHHWSPWPVQDAPSYVSNVTQQLCLQHTEQDSADGIRAFAKPVLEVLKAHMDVQHGDGRAALLRYVATYAPKFSDSFPTEAADVGSAHSMAKRILFDFKPLEPEMWMILAGQMFPMCHYGGTLIGIVAPYPGMEKKPNFVTLYEKCEWRSDGMTLLEFLRKANKDGGIV